MDLLQHSGFKVTLRSQIKPSFVQQKAILQREAFGSLFPFLVMTEVILTPPNQIHN